jgi:DNA ligase-1
MRRIAVWSALTCACSVGLPLECHAALHDPPALMLAETYDGESDLDVSAFYVSEKLDGVRAYWDGNRLLTRSGIPIDVPDWFTRDWPAVPMDGELWGGRSTFEQTSGTVRSRKAPDEAWRFIRYCVFDLPSEPGPFEHRWRALRSLGEATRAQTLAIVEQARVRDVAELKARLWEVERQGGEGLILHRADSRYVGARTGDLLKFKSYADAEAQVVGYVEGRGKYAGMMGALIVAMPDGRRFKIGAGFTDSERRNPPALGSWITYAYNGQTDQGVPRFARFLRVRAPDGRQP